MSTSQSQLLNRVVSFHDLGTISYSDGYRLQLEKHSEVLRGENSGSVLMLEHKPVLTLGKHADLSYVLLKESDREAMGVDCVRTDRGGEVTAHMPGQIVVYPILPVLALGFGPRDYVNALMQAVIKTLSEWGIEARCDSEFPGVWVGSQKICAVGVRIKEKVSLHGIALNVNNSLELFSSIVPCGIKHLGVTSMREILGREISLEDVKTRLSQRLSEQLSLTFAG